jgi:hypothetical protein
MQMSNEASLLRHALVTMWRYVNHALYFCNKIHTIVRVSKASEKPDAQTQLLPDDKRSGNWMMEWMTY